MKLILKGYICQKLCGLAGQVSTRHLWNNMAYSALTYPNPPHPALAHPKPTTATTEKCVKSIQH